MKYLVMFLSWFAFSNARAQVIHFDHTHQDEYDHYLSAREVELADVTLSRMLYGYPQVGVYRELVRGLQQHSVSVVYVQKKLRAGSVAIHICRIHERPALVVNVTYFALILDDQSTWYGLVGRMMTHEAQHCVDYLTSWLHLDLPPTEWTTRGFLSELRAAEQECQSAINFGWLRTGVTDRCDQFADMGRQSLGNWAVDYYLSDERFQCFPKEIREAAQEWTCN